MTMKMIIPKGFLLWCVGMESSDPILGLRRQKQLTKYGITWLIEWREFRKILECGFG